MVMVFTIVSATQEKVIESLETAAKRRAEEEERRKQEHEEAERVGRNGFG
jgi:hypothetical protein